MKSALAAGSTDLQFAFKLGDIELTERFSAADFPDDTGPKTKDGLRILSAESEFLKPPAAAVPGDPPLSPADRQALLARARAYAADYIRDLPDFVCTRITRRYDDVASVWAAPDPFTRLQTRDATSSELTYSRGEESDAPQIVDRPTCGSISQGLTSHGEFGSIVAALFADGGEAMMAWSHWETLNGRRAAVFGYSVDKVHSNYTVVWCCSTKAGMKVPQQVKTAYRGELSVDPDTGAILRVTRMAALPLSFPTSKTDTMVEYRPVRVGEALYLCPARSVIVADSRRSQYEQTRAHYVNEMVFTNYHKFVTSSVLRLGRPPVTSVPVAPPARPGKVSAAAKESSGGCSEEAAAAARVKSTAAPASPAVSSTAPPTRPPGGAHFRVLRFSPDGKYVLAQDNVVVIVFAAQPFRVRFRIAAENAADAHFTPDSREVLFISSVTHADEQHLSFASHAAHVERWSIADRARVGFTEMSLQTCHSVGLSPDGQVVVCLDFGGTLRLLSVATGQAFFEKEMFAIPYPIHDSPHQALIHTSDLGGARVDFSPDSRFVMITSMNNGSTLAWDLRDRKPVNLSGALKDLRSAGCTFFARDRLLVRRIETDEQGRRVETSAVIGFPSGEVLSKPVLPVGPVFRAADPAFVLVRSPFQVNPRRTQPVVQAVELSTGQIVGNETVALDVFGDWYAGETAGGELVLNQHGDRQMPGGPAKVGRFLRRRANISTSGRVLRTDEKQLVVRTDDRREVTLRLSNATIFFDGADVISPRDVRAGEIVEAESSETDDEEFDAISVTRRPAPSQAAEEASELPAPAAPGTRTAATLPAPTETFLQEARRLAAEQSASLPGYGCNERVSRYRSNNHSMAPWKLQDVVDAEIVSNDGRQTTAAGNGEAETPRRTGNRNWSAGDFNAVLAEVLAPSSSARVEYRKEAKIGKVEALAYAFTIDADHSRWLVLDGGQAIHPACIGTIWFDRETKRVLRIEFQGTDIPEAFPEEAMELAIDYDYVALSGKTYLVPKHADQMGCRRRAALCTKNSIDFSGCRRLDSGSPVSTSQNGK